MREYILLRAMRYCDIMQISYKEVSAWRKNLRSFTIRILPLGVIPTQASGLTETTTSQMPHIESGALADCIRKYGKMLMGLFQRAITFTTRMKTRLTTHSKTDRKSTRLNSSHTVISYAVFCLNK